MDAGDIVDHRDQELDIDTLGLAGRSYSFLISEIAALFPYPLTFIEGHPDSIHIRDDHRKQPFPGELASDQVHLFFLASQFVSCLHDVFDIV